MHGYYIHSLAVSLAERTLTKEPLSHEKILTRKTPRSKLYTTCMTIVNFLILLHVHMACTTGADKDQHTFYQSRQLKTGKSCFALTIVLWVGVGALYPQITGRFTTMVWAAYLISFSIYSASPFAGIRTSGGRSETLTMVGQGGHSMPKNSMSHNFKPRFQILVC